MKHFELSLKEEIDVYISSGLTPTELFILRLLFLAEDGYIQYIKEYLSNVSNGKELLVKVLTSLKDKQIINSTFNIPVKGQTLDFKGIPYNKNFLKKYIRDTKEIGKEFFEAYPPFITINGKMFSIRNFTKANLFSFEDFCSFYAKSIKSSNATHERIMEALNYAKDHNIIHYSILEFLASRKWEEIEFIQNSGDVNGYRNSELI
jgi:hypothetical protein